MCDAVEAPSQIETDASSDGGAGEACATVDAQVRMLGRLAEAGLQIAIAIEQRVKGAPPDEPLSELNAAAEAFARVSRAVRLCILLQGQLIEGRQEREGARRRREEHAGRAVAIVRRVARDHCEHDPFAVSAITREAAERLDTDDIYGLVADRPIGELVALICRDLGLDPDWDALAQEAWAQEEAHSGASGSPFLASPLPLDEREVGSGGHGPASLRPTGHPPPPPSAPPFDPAQPLGAPSPA